jgi:membrane-associated phospholipid phosphatase
MRPHPALRRLVRPLLGHDVLTVGFLGLLSAIAVAVSGNFDGWRILLVENALLIVGIIALAEADARAKSKFLHVVHLFYIAPMIFAGFKEVYMLIRPVNPAEFDDLLIGIDYAMFGVHPTQWLLRIAWPPLTEYLQLCYTLFYLLPVALAVEFIVRKREDLYDDVVLVFVYGFYLSYIAYFALPAVGPRFTLHDFASTPRELPGVVITDALRAFINAGESISTDAPNPRAEAQRDAFPSGHVQMSLLAIWIAWRHRARIRLPVTIVAGSLVFATVYLRYHYVVDVLGGLIFFLITVATVPRIERWVARFRRSSLS